MTEDSFLSHLAAFWFSLPILGYIGWYVSTKVKLPKKPEQPPKLGLIKVVRKYRKPKSIKTRSKKQ